MALLRLLGFDTDRTGAHRRTETAELKARVNALQAALNQCRSLAGHCGRSWRNMMMTGAVAAMALGVVVGANLDSIGRGLTSLGESMGLVQAASTSEAAYAAYQAGRYAAALRVAGPLAEQGDARAQSLMGYLNYHGRGVKRNDPEALRWFQLAGEKGDAEAQYHLGIMYGEGQSVPQDYAAAAAWYRRAADQGHAQAQYNLGLAYAKGEGVEQDNVQAHMWFNVASARFPPSDSRNRGAAVRNRDVVAGKMSREELAEAQTLAREWAAK
jgi:TPR repeat protein